MKINDPYVCYRVKQNQKELGTGTQYIQNEISMISDPAQALEFVPCVYVGLLVVQYMRRFGGDVSCCVNVSIVSCPGGGHPCAGFIGWSSLGTVGILTRDSVFARFAGSLTKASEGYLLLHDSKLVVDSRAGSESFSNQNELVFAFCELASVDKDVMPRGTERTACVIRDEAVVVIAGGISG